MKKIFLLFSSLVLLFSCQQKDDNLDLKYEVLNQLISDEISNDKLSNTDLEYIYNISVPKELNFEQKITNLLSNEEIPPPPGGRIRISVDSIFNKQDVESMLLQEKTNLKFQFDSNRINSKVNFIDQQQFKKLIEENLPAKEYWKKFRKIFGNKCLRTYSVPYFSKTKNICIVIFSESCDSLWGRGVTGIYKKENGKWKLIKTSGNWVS